MSTHDITRHATGQSQHCEQPYDGADCHCGSGSSKTLVAGAPRIALAGAPNAGKTSIYNALTGLHAKTGNYPGVTVARSLGDGVLGRVLLQGDDPGAGPQTQIGQARVRRRRGGSCAGRCRCAVR